MHFGVQHYPVQLVACFWFGYKDKKKKKEDPGRLSLCKEIRR